MDFPPNIERLFKPRLPIKQPRLATGYPLDARRTPNILSLAQYRQHWLDYRASDSSAPQDTSNPRPTNALEKRKPNHTESFRRQLDQWNSADVDSLPHYNADPSCSVFILRLPYLVDEPLLTSTLASSLSVSASAIVSTRIVRDPRGTSRGYAFVVFDSPIAAAQCVRTLAQPGLPFANSKFPACVDIERARVIRNWLPRRLGGGLGGRHFSRNRWYASAAAKRFNAGHGKGSWSGPRDLYRPPHSVPIEPLPPSVPYRPHSGRDKYAQYSSSVPGRSARPNQDQDRRSARSMRDRY